MKQIFDFLVLGGVVMIPIGLGSVIGLAIFLERMFSLQASKISPRSVTDLVVKAVREGQHQKGREECLRSNTPLGRLLLAGLDSASRGRDEMRQVFEELGRRETARMERFIEALGTTASLEPLLGLLGTVFGMIQVFQQVVLTAREGAVDPSQLANGIWQALITTAAGLSVAIPAYVGYRYLLARTGRRAMELEEAASMLIDAAWPSDAPAAKGQQP
ncbi:MAG: MotA/TolQ/ExbB proton channel family protein [Myxococcota bacterium]|jgi:biopolymer transport protein ExbB|nr:MotA/TolQ/ExbB proton channel family protein [Myxococcota bacterium]